MATAEKPSVVEALSKVMDAVQAVGKKDRNTEQSYMFRGIDAVVNAVGPELRKHGVVVLPMLQEAGYRDVLTVREKRSRECTVRVCYRFYGPAGDFIDAVVPGESMDFGDKGAAKAMSVAYRIALLQALCIPTDEPEPDSHTYERAHSDGWDQAERAATEAQMEAYDAFRKEIEAAESLEEIAAIGHRVKPARQAGEITAFQYDQLARQGARHRAELEAAAKPAEPEGGDKR